MLGETLGTYRITHKIAEGGMGVVYAAEHTLIGRHAAVKVLHPELSSRRDMVERFFNEARATTAIRHPGIVEVIDFGFDAHGRAFIVMELLVGETLAQRARNGGVPMDLAVSVMRRVAQAVGAAHDKGVVHRDLKPDNVFLLADPDVAFGIRPKVLDFGIAKLVHNDPSHMRTRTGAVMGTPTYMSPEQCRGSGVVDHRADIYALGAILYELIGGRPPFVAEGFGELIAAHMTTPPAPLHTLAPTVPPGLEAVVMRCLEKSPDQRFGSIGELVATLDAATGILSYTPVPPPAMMWSPSHPPPVTQAPTTLGGAAAEAVGTMMPPPRARWPWLVGGFALVGAAVAVVIAMSGGSKAPAKAAAQPEPVAQPGPKPAPVPVPVPEPVPVPDSVPVPVPVPVPDPVAVVDPDPVPVPPVPKPDPAKPKPHRKPHKTSTGLETDL